MSKKGALTRLQKELCNFYLDPPPLISVSVNERNMLEWDYLLKGPTDTPYEGGEYHGRVRFPPEYPFAPPEIVMYTESGRFKQNTPLCLSMSNFHPETWNPAWSVSTILQGLQSFMVEDTHTQGSMHPLPTEPERRRLAGLSIEANQRSAVFRKMFPNGFMKTLHVAGEDEEEEEKPEQGGAQEEVTQETSTPTTETAAEEKAVPAPEAAAVDLTLGARVTLQGMTAKPEMNGSEGVIDEIKGTRFHIKLDCGEIVKVRKGMIAGL